MVQTGRIQRIAAEISPSAWKRLYILRRRVDGNIADSGPRVAKVGGHDRGRTRSASPADRVNACRRIRRVEAGIEDCAIAHSIAVTISIDEAKCSDRLPRSGAFSR